MGNWEYEVVHLQLSEKWRPKKQEEEVTKFKARLNELGGQGWELINYQPIPLTGSFSGNVNGYAYLALFKRGT